ncbi:AAA family ATPase [Psychrobacillus sp. NPDC096426]|uniref:AAA family ATPase n=1 Tax=Psychrobacillus sp. NPDC096426 TaxID=3364491 RepID=UPI0038261A83
MKINHVRIREAWGLKDLLIKFDKPSEEYFKKSNISIIVGENGTGKTSILRLLSYAFFPEMNEKQELYPQFHINYEINEKEYEIGALGNESRSISRPKKVIVSSYAVFEAFKVNYKKGNKVNNYVGEYAGTEYYYCGPTVKGGISSLKEAIPTIIKSFYNAKENKKLSESINQLMSVIGYSGYPFIEISLPRLNHSRMRKMDYSDEDILLLQEKSFILKNEIKYRSLKPLGGGKYLISPEAVDDNFLEMLLELDESEFFSKIFIDLIFRREGENVHFSQMSSGELTMFFRFFPLIDKICDDCVVLIDEPETHLHPKWIKNYINLLVKLFGNFNVHFIIATHSPLIASDVPKECIIGLKRINNNLIKQYNIHEKTLGGETGDILQDVFNLEEYGGEFTKSKKEKIKQLLIDSKINEALNLYDDLSLNSDKYKFFDEIVHLLPDIGKE